MESNDLSIIFLTANLLPEGWAKYQREVLLKAAGELPIITISRKSLDWGDNILDNEPKSLSNIYKQLLRGCQRAETPYIAVAEDDTLYPYEHFHGYRPPLNAVAYNLNRMGLFTWRKPTYFWKNRISNSVLIASRGYLMDALEERFRKWPDGTPDNLTGEVGRAIIENNLGISTRNVIDFTTEVSVVRVDHPFGSDHLAISKRKRMGICQSYDIPYWGKASDIISKFK